MAAYLIVDIDLKDTDRMPEYRDAAPPAIRKYGGRELLGGHWQRKRVVVLEFPSVEQAKRWYDSEAYRERGRPSEKPHPALT